MAIDIDSRNFLRELPRCLEAIKSADIMGIDLELTGIYFGTENHYSLADNSQQRYEKMLNVVRQFGIIQVGISCMKGVSGSCGGSSSDRCVKGTKETGFQYAFSDIHRQDGLTASSNSASIYTAKTSPFSSASHPNNGYPPANHHAAGEAPTDRGGHAHDSCSGDAEVPSYDCQTYNFYLFPHEIAVGRFYRDSMVKMSAAAMDFNRKHGGVDFGKWLKYGMGFLDEDGERGYLQAIWEREEKNLLASAKEEEDTSNEGQRRDRQESCEEEKRGVSADMANDVDRPVGSRSGSGSRSQESQQEPAGRSSTESGASILLKAGKWEIVQSCMELIEKLSEKKPIDHTEIQHTDHDDRPDTQATMKPCANAECEETASGENAGWQEVVSNKAARRRQKEEKEGKRTCGNLATPDKTNTNPSKAVAPFVMKWEQNSLNVIKPESDGWALEFHLSSDVASIIKQYTQERFPLLVIDHSITSNTDAASMFSCGDKSTYRSATGSSSTSSSSSSSSSSSTACGRWDSPYTATTLSGPPSVNTRTPHGSGSSHVASRGFAQSRRTCLKIQKLGPAGKALRRVVLAREILSSLGFRTVWSAVKASVATKVFHNGAYDAMFLLHNFERPLPSKVQDFKWMVRRCFGDVYDTKVIAALFSDTLGGCSDLGALAEAVLGERTVVRKKPRFRQVTEQETATHVDDFKPRQLRPNTSPKLSSTSTGAAEPQSSGRAAVCTRKDDTATERSCGVSEGDSRQRSETNVSESSANVDKRHGYHSGGFDALMTASIFATFKANLKEDKQFEEAKNRFFMMRSLWQLNCNWSNEEDGKRQLAVWKEAERSRLSTAPHQFHKDPRRTSQKSTVAEQRQADDENRRHQTVAGKSYNADLAPAGCVGSDIQDGISGSFNLSPPHQQVSSMQPPEFEADTLNQGTFGFVFWLFDVKSAFNTVRLKCMFDGGRLGKLTEKWGVPLFRWLDDANVLVCGGSWREERLGGKRREVEEKCSDYKISVWQELKSCEERGLWQCGTLDEFFERYNAKSEQRLNCAERSSNVRDTNHNWQQASPEGYKLLRDALEGLG